MIAICMIAWNQIESTRRLLDSVARNSHRHRLEFFLLDNGSDDGRTFDYLKSVNPSFLGRNPENRSIYEGWNRVLRAALEKNPELLCLISNDVEVGPRWLDAVVREASMPGKRYFLPNACLKPDRWPVEAERTIAELSGRCVPGRAGWCLFLGPDTVREFLPIPEDLRLWYGDDWIHHRLAKAGYECAIILDCLAWHHTSTTFYATPGYVEIVARDREIWDRLMADEPTADRLPAENGG